MFFLFVMIYTSRSERGCSVLFPPIRLADCHSWSDVLNTFSRLRESYYLQRAWIFHCLLVDCSLLSICTWVKYSLPLIPIPSSFYFVSKDLLLSRTLLILSVSYNSLVTRSLESCGGKSSFLQLLKIAIPWHVISDLEVKITRGLLERRPR